MRVCWVCFCWFLFVSVGVLVYLGLFVLVVVFVCFGLLFVVCFNYCYFILPVPVSDLLLYFQTKNFRAVHQKRNLQVRSTSSSVPKLLWKPPVAHLTHLLALSATPFCSTPINFHGPPGTSQVLHRTHFEHALFFFPITLTTLHPQCQSPENALNQQKGVILHHPFPTETIVLSPAMPITFARCCLQTLAESNSCLPSYPSSPFGYTACPISDTC